MRSRLLVGFVGCVVSAVVLGVGLSCVAPDPEYCENRSQCPYADTPLGPMQLFCHATRHVCVLNGDVCIKDEDCGVDRPRCNVDTNACTACRAGDTSDTSCARFKERPLCGVASDGSGATLCLACRNNLDCPSATPICDSQQCRKCSEHSDCEGELRCDDGNTCTDSLVCIGAGEVTPERDGSCAQNTGTNHRIVYVNNLDPSCATVTNPDEPLKALDGTLLGSQLAQPQCTMEQAVRTARQQNRRYIRVFGQQVLPPSAELKDGADYSFIGAPRKGTTSLASVRSLGGTFRLSGGGSLTLDQLDIFEQNQAALVKCTSSSRLTVRRSLLRGNASVNDTVPREAAIDINDCTTVLDGNTIGVSKLAELTDPLATAHWKGIRIGGSAGATTYLIQNNLIAGNLGVAMDLQGTGSIPHLVSRFNTIVGNGRKLGTSGAVFCAIGATGQEFSHSILWHNTRSPGESSQLANSAYCGFKDLVVGADEGLMNAELKRQEPNLDANLHLMAGSQCCVDQVTPAPGETLPSQDRLGTPRPQGARWDIGADELKP